MASAAVLTFPCMPRGVPLTLTHWRGVPTYEGFVFYGILALFESSTLDILQEPKQTLTFLFSLASLHQRRQHDEGLCMPQGRTSQPLHALAPDRHASLALALPVCFK